MLIILNQHFLPYQGNISLQLMTGFTYLLQSHDVKKSSVLLGGGYCINQEVSFATNSLMCGP